MTREEYSVLQETFVGLIFQENKYCADYVKNNPDDRKYRESIRYYIVSGLNHALYSLHEMKQTGKITVE